MSAARDVPPAFRHSHRVVRDPEEFADVVSGASLVADFLKPNTTPARIEQFQTPDWSLDFHEAHVRARVVATLPPDWVSIGLLRSQAGSVWYSNEGRQGLLLCNPPGTPIDGFITPGFKSMAVGVPLAVWEKCRALAGGKPASFHGLSAFELPPHIYADIERQLRAVRTLLRTASAAPETAVAAARRAAEFAMHVAATAWELSSPIVIPRESLRNRIRLARHAETWLRDRLPAKVSISDLCLDLRVSRRELEYALQTAFDCSPQAYLQRLRLNAIRRALRRADPSHDTIISIAFDHGVTHLGRFAAQYRALFGEKPVETLKG